MLLAAACAEGQETRGPTIGLPEPELEGETSLEEALYRRQGERSFEDKPLSKGQLGQLLWAAVGKSIDGVSGPTRTAASAGGIYPVEAYAVVGNVQDLASGVYAYGWRSHELRRIRDDDVRRPLADAALGQRFIAEAPVVIVLAANYAATERKYGSRGTERYVHMDAGHAAQNVLLQATADALGGITVGAFRDGTVRDLLRIEYPPLYLIPIGVPR